MGAKSQANAEHSFRSRALAEAARYGSDPYVFVRELLQNARDAGARRVEIEVTRDGSRDRFVCRDDGCGMTYEHARRYLFALYASSKESAAEAGEFGIGFWSVLRLEPSRITVRSRGLDHDAWEVSVDGRLERVAAAASSLDAGTEVVLERPANPAEDFARAVFEATWRYGRFLTLRDDPEAPLAITVGGRTANAELALPQPSAPFRGRGFRGVVGLGAAPEVELFAKGLFVRSAACLQDLRGAGQMRAPAGAEDALAKLPSLAPRVLIDSAELDLLLARSDARYDHHLRRILRAAEKALTRLITRHLQALRPQPWYRLALGALRDRLERWSAWLPVRGNGWRFAAAGLAGLVLGLAAWWLAPASGSDRPGSPRLAGRDPGAAVAARPAARPAARRESTVRRLEGPGTADVAVGRAALDEYVDLASRYRGPRPGGLGEDRSRLAMLYEPAAAVPFFAALVIEDLGEGWRSGPAGALHSYPPTPCEAECLTARLRIAGEAGALRIPVPTGHRLEAVTLDGVPVEVFETAAGEAIVRLERARRGVLEYRSGPAPAPARRPAPPIALPAELAGAAAGLLSLPLHHRVQHGLDYVAGRIVYDDSPGLPGAGFIEAALAAGRGDCDVQNGVLVALLRSAGVDARLAVGYVGVQGTVAPGLHAWVEYGDEHGNRFVADASVRSGSAAGIRPAVPERITTAGPASPGVMAPRPYTAGLAASPAARLAPWAILLVAAASAALWWRRRAACPVELAGGDLAALLGGALRHPEAFAGMPALAHGRFVPLVGGGAVSLARARRLGRKSRLFCSAAGSSLARRAAARGVPVVDAATAEGRVLSLALGAIDLDRWSSALSRSSETDFCRRVNRRLETAGAPWRLRQATAEAPDSEPWTEIALEDLRLGRRQIVVELRSPEFAPVGRLAESPAAAAFTLVDVLLHRLDLADRQRARILAAFARPAIGEAATGGGR